MIKPVFCIRDDVAEVCMPPFVEDTDSSAIRAFEFTIANGKGISSFRPSDFSLLKIGGMDMSTGVLTPSVPVVLSRGRVEVDIDPKYGSVG